MNPNFRTWPLPFGFPYRPGVYHDAPILRLVQSTLQCQQSLGSTPAAVHLPHGPWGRSGIHTETPVGRRNRIKPSARDPNPTTTQKVYIYIYIYIYI